MKSCPTCNRTYPDDTLAFCLMDGSVLSAPHGAEQTLRIPQARTTNSPATEILPETTVPGGPPLHVQSTIHALRPQVPAIHHETAISERSQAKRTVWPWLLVAIAVLVFGIFAVRMLASAFFGNKKSPTSQSSTSRPASSAAGNSLTVEDGVDRPGFDYRNFDLPQANSELCRDACANDSNCLAYTFVRPGIQGPRAKCWLKSKVPPAGQSSCCISGVKTISN
ncbi:MAG: PAN domain-containing protein [Pyrinomonadaceae bacterium]